jgi:hypothetical protein
MQLRRLLKPAEKKAFRVMITPEGLSVEEVGGPQLWQMNWTDVRKVWAYKKDCFTVDQIRVVFVGFDGMAYEITEDDENLSELKAHLSNHIPLPNDWYAKLALSSAFDSTIRNLFEREIPTY